jgi:hypothetical protein
LLHGYSVPERNSKSRMRHRRTASRGDRYAVVLEFEFLSGKMAAVQQ